MTDDYFGPERRQNTGRRPYDGLTCPYHKIKCRAIEENKANIKELSNKFATKEEIKAMNAAIKDKAPKWVVNTMIVTAVPVMIALMVWIGGRLDIVSEIKANQKIIMEAFDISVHEKRGSSDDSKNFRQSGSQTINPGRRIGNRSVSQTVPQDLPAR